MTDESCSFGCNLFQTIEECFAFMSKGKIFKCYVPIKDNKINFIDDKDKFRCLRFYLTSKEVFLDYVINYEKYWKDLTEGQKNNVCENNLNFNYEKYWNELTKEQKNILAKIIVIKY